MSAISEWFDMLDTVFRLLEKNSKEHEQHIAKLEATVQEQAKRIEALEQQLNTLHVFSKQVLVRLTKLEDWKQDCESEDVTPVGALHDPFGKYEDPKPKRDVTVRRNASLVSCNTCRDEFSPDGCPSCHKNNKWRQKADEDPATRS
jgi:uncharacterized coiled-coil protein SlyX